MKVRASRISVNAIVVILAIVWWIPIVWSFAVSLKPIDTFYSDITKWFLPPYILDNYRIVFDNPHADITQWLLNSAIVSTASTILIIFLSTLAGYAFSKFNFPLKRFWFWIVVAGMMIPFQSLIIPNYLFFRALGWLNSYQALILPYLGSSFGVVIMKSFIDGLPHDLFEAARIDGCSSLRIYFRIVLPLIKPALAALFIITFLQRWNDFLWPYIVITKQNMMTLPTGLVMFRAQQGVGMAYSMAANMVAILPVMIIFLIFQKNIVKGVSMTGIKG